MRKPKAVCTVGLIIVNIAVFMVLSLLGDTENGYFMLHHGAMYEPMILENQEYYRFFTCMFLHFGIQHLLNNMVMLGALGWQLTGNRKSKISVDLFYQWTWRQRSVFCMERYA